jgi:hypothetical protein
VGGPAIGPSRGLGPEAVPEWAGLQRGCESRRALGLTVDRAPRRMEGTGARHGAGATQMETTMLWAILVILLILWALGLIGSIGGGFIHLLLVLAVIVLAVQLLQGRRSV